jgi:hypothetical protein
MVFGAVICAAGTVAAFAGDDQIVIGQWRTEPKKSLVCGGEEGGTLVEIAKRANAFYLGGAKKGSPEYEKYWAALEKALKERRCFVAAQIHHLPDELVYEGPAELDKVNKRFKVLGTTIEENGTKFPAFTMTTLSVRH